jgi:hypothetical protein
MTRIVLPQMTTDDLTFAGVPQTAAQRDRAAAVNGWEDESLPVKTRKALINRALADIDLEQANLSRSKAHLRALRQALG